MVNGRMIIEMAGVFWIIGKRGINIRVTGKWIGSMALAGKSRSILSIRVTFSRIRRKALGFLLKMAIGTKLTGKMILCMVKANSSNLTAHKHLFITLMALRVSLRVVNLAVA
jgi:hypothetical protein